MAEETAPQSTLPYPPIHQDKKFVVLSDWDGTITTHDSNDYLTDNLGYGNKRRRERNQDILSGAMPYRDAFAEMLESVSKKGHKLDECAKILRENIVLDPGFKEFYYFCKANDIPFVIVSSGMEPIIRAVLSNLLAEEADKIDIIANAADVQADGSWSLKYRHPSSGFGHDKSQAILPYRRLEHPPTLFFFGDGVSDMSAAKHADLLFVKEKPYGDNDLADHCQREGIKHLIFTNFAQAVPVVQSIVEGKKSTEDWLNVGRCT
ncbi:HAD-like domain-containing protein [Amylostereum chailletii]|nr:HAD-like domain-containing protein [Amylostereum chailletii]